ncbi:PRTRC system protein B [Flavobacterium pectinovorum]|uniref:PRTRC system protein B n=1 Tax=Flavobacterium pectinovorum TaxID=29533 RepID=A0AB36P813_9FLAO|nr:PRTRC system protein B [Flavobacterium pectinovorum]OXB07766.1 PRTRC system protein B [Flavobacterium pectinovorum]SHM79829.1 PRTRC system protein B [Flavobacterium pectinovorum]
MKKTTDITENFGTLYHPKSALVFYETKGTDSDVYVEHFDMDKNGTPINAHPLTEREAKELARALATEKDNDKAFLKSSGILPTNILHINPNKDKGAVLWYTKTQLRQMYFVDSLGIPSGKAHVPAMLWLASKKSLTVFALASDRRPTEKTALHYAPFFNIYEKGNVCMGTVDIDIKNSASVEEFTRAWEHYFFNSYFSHSLCENLTRKNIVNLWKDLIQTGNPFPKEVLKKNSKTLKNLLR